jgi:hypothetical protein
MSPNETKISDGYPGASANRSGSVLIIENVIAQRVAVRCIARLDALASQREKAGQKKTKKNSDTY